MSDPTKVFICELLAPEVRQALVSEELADVEVIPYKVDFSQPEASMEDLERKIMLHARPGDVVCVFGSEWIASRPTGLDLEYQTYVPLGACFELLAGPALLDRALARGGYLLFPGLLRQWREMVRAHSLDSEEMRDEFSRTISEVVFLDTGIGEDAQQDLEEFSTYVGKPHSTIMVGTDVLRLNLSKVILGARLGREVERAQSEWRAQTRVRSEYMIAFDLLEKMSQGTQEEEVAGSMLDILQMLFSPAETDYFSVDQEGRLLIFDYVEGKFQAAQGTDLDQLLSNVNKWDEASNGFKLVVENKEQVLGIAVLRQLAFPQFHQDYIDLATQISVVFGLGVANARSYRILRDAETRVERAFALERTMLEISQGFFARLDFDRAVQESLARVGEAVSASRVQLLQFAKDLRTLTCTHEWTAPSVLSNKVQLASVPMPTQGWLLDRVQTEGTVRLVHLAGLEEASKAQLAPFVEANVQAMALTSVVVEGRQRGLLCLQHIEEREELDADETSMLRFLAQTLSMALQRRKNQEDLASLAESVSMSNKVLRHDIRNELMVFTGSLQLYDMKKETRHLERAKRSSDRLIEILDHFKELDTFLQSSRGLFSVDLEEAIRKALAPHQIPYQIEGHGMVMADFAINSVLDNLVRNAKKHGEAKSIRFVISREGAFVELSVADDGSGIPKEARERLFQEGFSYGDARGTGLGLFWIRKTMERYGGWVRLADSEMGARFLFGFPLP